MSSMKGYLQALITFFSVITTCCNLLRPVKELCEPWKRVELKSAEKVSNKSIWDSDNQILYPPSSYWEYIEQNGSTTLYGCPCKLDKPCMRKCCQRNEAMDYDTLKCIPHNAKLPWFRPNVTADEEGNFRMENVDYFGLTSGYVCSSYLLEPEVYPEEDQFYVNFTDGTLSIPVKNKTGLGPKDYCLEYFPEIDSYLPYVCFNIFHKYRPDPCKNLRHITYPLGMFISSVFLITSLVVFILIPEMRNVHGKCLMCHMASLLCAYIFLSIISLLSSVQGRRPREILSEDICQIFGLIIYLSYLCSFFWLNIMCIDICIAFSSFRPMGIFNSERATKKFILYMLYAWGIPFVIFLITAVLELHPDSPDTLQKPKFRTICWFESYDSQKVYLIVPGGVIVLCNIILFLITASNIFMMERDTNQLTQGDNRRHDSNEDKNRFKLYIKLSILMGISWALEIISWQAGITCLSLFADTLNTLQVFFIFLMFFWNRKVRHLIKMKFSSNEVNNSSLQMDGGSSEGPYVPTPSSNVPSTATVNGSGPFVPSNATGAANDDQKPPIEEEPEYEVTRL